MIIVNLEKATVLLIIEMLVAIGLFVPTCPNLLITFSNPMRKEEAIEISKNAKLFKEGIAVTLRYSSYAYFYNSTMVDRLKHGHNRLLYQEVPQGHSIWEVEWTFLYQEKPGGYIILIIVDAETGIITHQVMGAGLD
jgi:hypothetical protein